MRVAIVTVSDSLSGGVGSDTSGAAVRAWCERRGDDVVSHDVTEDETSVIAPLLSRLCDSASADLVITTGGTGLAPRDVTPEATLSVIEREAPGIAEYIRASSVHAVPRAALSRGVAGTRGRTLIVNLPGSTQGVEDGLTTLLPIIDHAIGVLTGAVTRHDAPSSGQPAA